MADQVKQSGRLIAVDGSRGKDVTAAANVLAAELKRRGIECAVSRWDASGLFSELAAGGRTSRAISARALSLVYAADLAFRLRWEIRPILEAGGVVIAAPYLDTAAAFGVSCGLADTWLRELMRFAPAPQFRGRAEERKIDRPWKPRLDRGYAEYAAALLGATAAGRISKKERRLMMATMDEARGRTVFHLTSKGIGALAKRLTDNRKGASRRSASRPRTGRK
jgi:hypothetical protein